MKCVQGINRADRDTNLIFIILLPGSGRHKLVALSPLISVE
jgi:hypothetical protein